MPHYSNYSHYSHIRSTMGRQTRNKNKARIHVLQVLGENLNLDFANLGMAGSYVCVPSNEGTEGSAGVNLRGQ